MCVGINGQFTITISSSPSGIPVEGSINTYDYPLLSSVVLTCNVVSNDRSSFTVTSYHWNTTGCYTHPSFNYGYPRCFPNGQRTQHVTGTDLTAEDAGTIICTATINGIVYTSGPFTLRISGEQGSSVVIYNYVTHLYFRYCND